VSNKTANKDINEIEILVITNTLDFTSDYVCLELRKRGKKYLRINRDEFEKYEIVFDIKTMELSIIINSEKYVINNNLLKAVYYRAPIYLRDIYQPQIEMEEQLYRTQWTAFIRNLFIFENINWLNNPVATFKAENKLLQLKYAENLGFLCPTTIVTNTNKLDIRADSNYIVKSLDTALLKSNGKEAFVYSTVIKGNEIKNSNLNISPIVIQEYIYPKVDIRVSVISDKIYAVKILENNLGIDGDWRLKKNDISYVPINLPEDIEKKCVQLLKDLGLAFGGIDLIESKGKYYFIEVNPTGEWAWLVDNSGLKIYEGICDYLGSE